MSECENCIKKDVCKMIDKYKETKEMLEETLLNNENEEVLEAVNMRIECNFKRHIPTNPRTQFEQHVPSLF